MVEEKELKQKLRKYRTKYDALPEHQKLSLGSKGIEYLNKMHRIQSHLDRIKWKKKK